MSLNEVLEEKKALELITQFDFYLGSPTARQLLSYFMLKDFNQNCIYLTQEVKRILILNAKRCLNIINEVPSSTTKATRALMLIERMEKDTDNFKHLDNLFLSLTNKVRHKIPLKKEDLSARLSFWEEDSLKNYFYILINKLETIANGFFYETNLKDEKIKTNILSIKEDFLKCHCQEIYNKVIFISKLINLIIKNHEKFPKVTEIHSKKHENTIFIERLACQLSKRYEGIEEIKKMQVKMHELLDKDIHFSEMMDDEIHNIHNAISKENITHARLEIRLNDTEYPLSVAYREHIRVVLQHLEE
ncbi:hypothetical protein AXG55_02365 [Silvanigrella aquatica]|uniref:Uncharacterized protein n=1 Tax=Silvanigrella aquatica TaxID=1915309 RepID=A0A1L4CY05_9BACT|nr:hypothetical protein AXG55_02365 [Silvanigrella aquatica]